MVLIRLCHVSDMPTPGDLLRRLSSGGTVPAASAAIPSSSGATSAPVGRSGEDAPTGGGFAAVSRAVANGSSMSDGAVLATGSPAAAQAPAAAHPSTAPVLANFRDVAALVKQQREAMLHAHLLHSTHLVRFAPPVIELRTEPEAPRDLAPKLAALLSNATGERWTIALSAAMGEPTLAAQGNAADAVRREEAADHPLIRAIMQAFPGARIDQVSDTTVDDYGLPLAPAAVPLGEPEMPDFAPIDAEYFDESPNEFPWESDP
jgi:DNA polymerase-3 subunit gamma/tau